MHWVDQLGWTLVHALWQGAAIWLVLQVALMAMRRNTAQARYLASCIALAAMVLLPWGTFFATDFSGRLERERAGMGRGSSYAETAAPSPGPHGAHGVPPGQAHNVSPSYVRSDNESVSASGGDKLSAAQGHGDPSHRIVAGADASESKAWLFNMFDFDWFARGGFGLVVQGVLPWVVGAWCVGVLFFALRLWVGWRAMERLASMPLRPLDDMWQTRWIQLMLRAGVKRAVRMGEMAAVAVPTVAGWMKPVVLLPIGTFAGMPVEQLEAILLHELAHIRRHDIAVNLLQSVAETLFFYHPAVWSVSNTIRRERELACDDMAIAWCQDRLGYAEALAAVEAMRTDSEPVVSHAMAATGNSHKNGNNNGHGDLLSRVRRVLIGEDPRHVWPSSRMLTLGGLLAVCAYLATMFLGPAWASEILLTEERIKAVQTAREQAESVQEKLEARMKEGFDAQANTSPGGEAKRLLIFGTVRMEDGSPVPQPLSNLQLSAVSERSRGTSSASSNYSVNWKEDTTWEVSVEPGLIGIYSFSGVCAPLPMQLVDLPVRDGKCGSVDIVLKKGIPGRVRILSADGKPLSDVEITTVFNSKLGNRRSGSYLPSEPVIRTNSEGVAFISQVLPDTVLNLRAAKAGYQSVSADFYGWKAESPLDWTMLVAPLTTGKVVDAKTGKPVANARLEMAREQARGNSGNNMNYDIGQKPLTSTAQDGSFSIQSLNSDVSYSLYVTAPGYATRAFPFASGEKDKIVKLTPGLSITGKISDPQGLLRTLRDKKTHLEIAAECSIEVKQNFSMGHRTRSELVEKDGELTFALKDLSADNSLPLLLTGKDGCGLPISLIRPRVKLTESIPDYTFRVELAMPTTSPAISDNDDASVTRARATKKVELILDPGRGLPLPTGTIRVEYIDFGGESGGGGRARHNLYKVKNGRVAIQVPPGVEIEVFPAGLVGYWFEHMEIKVPADNSPWSTTLSLMPAGAIYGKITADPTLRDESYFPSIEVVEAPPGWPRDKRLNISYGSSSTASNGDSYFLGPLPLGGTYRVLLSDVPLYTVSEPVRLDASKPVVELPINRIRGTELRARFIDQEGKPIAQSTVHILFHRPNSTSSVEAGQTSLDGSIRIPEVSLDAPGYYELKIIGQGWKRNDVRIDKNTPQPVVIQLEKGDGL